MAWITALAQVGSWNAAIILVAAAFYLGALIAVGTVLFRVVFPDLPEAEGRSVSRMGAVAAWAAILLALLRWPLQAGYLAGGTFAGAIDPMLLGMVLESAQGSRLVMAVTGLLLVQAILLYARRFSVSGYGLGLAGGAVVLLAFTQVGHTVNEPRVVLGGLLLVHLLAAAFWIGSLWPLYRLAGHSAGGAHAARILARFGRVAAAAVGLLVLAGVVLAALLLGGIEPLITTAYGRLLLAKVVIVMLLLLLAATNKWLLVPAFERGDARAPVRLRRSIALEIVLATTILLVTAALTTVGSPTGG